MKTSILFLLIFLTLTGNSNAQKMDSTKRYIKVPAGYLMVLRQGDDVFAHLEKLAEDRKNSICKYFRNGFCQCEIWFLQSKNRKNMILKNLVTWKWEA